MKNKEILYQQFLEWERNELSSADANILTEKIKNDSFYKEIYNEYSLSKQIVIQHELSNIQQVLDTFEYGEPVKLWYQKPIYWLGLLSGLSIFIGVIVHVFHQENQEKDKLVSRTNSPSSKSIVKSTETTPTVFPSKKKKEEKKKIKITEKRSDSNKVIDQSHKEHEEIKLVENNNKFENVEEKVNLVLPDISVKEAKNQTLITPTVVEEIKPCNLNIQVSTHPTCLQENNGRISIAINNAEKPYEVWVNEEEIGGNTVYDLEKGIYFIEVQDQRHCGVSQKVEILSQLCIKKNNIIQPTQQIYWQLPELDEDMSLVIYDLSNKVVLEESLDLGDIYEWEGQNNNGENLPMGVYIFVLKGINHSYSGNITLIP